MPAVLAEEALDLRRLPSAARAVLTPPWVLGSFSLDASWVLAFISRSL